MTSSPANVAILGCGRSGTSIFGELFEAFDDYRYWSEPALAAIEASALDHRSRAIKVPQVDPEDDPPVGLSCSLDRLHAALPAPRVVFWMVRHPLDAICSLRIGLADRWNHHPRPPDWEEWLDRPLLERCGHHWATINGPGYAAVRDVAVVRRFEDLIDDPLTFAHEVATVIGSDGGSDAVRTWADRVRDRNDDQFVEARTSRRLSRPDHERRVGRWQENVDDADVRAIWPIVHEAATTLGYAPPDLSDLSFPGA